MTHSFPTRCCSAFDLVIGALWIAVEVLGEQDQDLLARIDVEPALEGRGVPALVPVGLVPVGEADVAGIAEDPLLLAGQPALLGGQGGLEAERLGAVAPAFLVVGRSEEHTSEL